MRPYQSRFFMAALACLTGVAGCDGATEPTPAPNRAPLAIGSIPGLSVAAGDSARVDVSPYFSDPDGDALSYGAETSDAAVAAVAVSGSTVTVTGVAAARRHRCL